MHWCTIFLLYIVISVCVALWHLVNYESDDNYEMITLKRVDSIGAIIYYFFSIPAKIITPITIHGFRLIKTVLTCKFK